MLRGRWPTLKVLMILPAYGIKYRDSSSFLGSDPDVLPVRRYFDAFRLCAHRNRLGYGARRDVDDADRCLVFVRCVKLLSILADVEVFRIGAAGNGAHNFPLRNVEDTDSISSLVGRRKGALIDVGPGNGRATERDINCFVIRARMNASRTFAERNGGKDVIVAGIDDAEIAAHLVGHVNSWGRGFRGRRLVRAAARELWWSCCTPPRRLSDQGQKEHIPILRMFTFP